MQFLEAAGGEEAIAVVQRHQPQIILMGIELPGINGIETTRRIKGILPRTRVIIISMYDTARYLSEAKAAGCYDFISKSELRSRLVPALKQLLAELPS